MLPRLLLAALLMLLLVVPSARGATYCVGTSCEGSPKPTIDAALAAAATSAGRDAIMLGEGPFTGSWTLPAGGGVDLIGPSTGAELISTGTAGLVVDHPDSLVENVTVRLKGMNGAYGIDVRAAGPTLRGVVVRDVPGTKQQVGIRVQRGAKLNAVSAEMSVPGSVGVLATGAPTVPLELYNVHLAGNHGLRAWEWTAPLKLDRLQVKATNTGIAINGAQHFVAENVAAWGGLVGLDAREATGTVRHATLASGTGAALWGLNAPLRVSDSVLVGGGSDLSSNTGMEFRRSAFRPARMEGQITQPGMDNVDLSKSWHGMPGVAAGVLQPVAGSALIDNGTPGGEAGFDVDLRARPVDGDRDGVARRDIGAFEAVEKTSVEPAKVTLVGAPAPVVATPTPTPVATPTPVPPAPAGPAKPQLRIGSVQGRRVLAGRAAGPVARVQVTARIGKRCAAKAGSVRRAQRCAWLPAAGREAWTLKFARKLPRGTYTVTARALDARGQVLVSTVRKVRVA